MIKIIIYILLSAGIFIGFWKIFEKAGRSAWEAFIPGYNIFIALKILERPWWWVFLFIFPGVNLIMLSVVSVNLSKAFGMDQVKNQIAAAVVPFIYLPYLGFTEGLQWLGPVDRSKLPKSSAREWGDAIIFAIVAASIIRGYFIEAFTIPTSSMEKSMLIGDYLFVSKVSYGSKVPNTPLSFPFAHHTLPGTTIPSYLEWIELPYMRLPGLGDVERYDVVVFNYPEGDSVFVDNQAASYYSIIRDQASTYKNSDRNKKKQLKSDEAYFAMARTQLLRQRPITVRPVDKRENYIKRCVGVPGDELYVKNRILFINGEQAPIPEMSQVQYKINHNGISPDYMKDKMDVNYQDMVDGRTYSNNQMIVPLTSDRAKEVEGWQGVSKIEAALNEAPTQEEHERTSYIAFPNHKDYLWTPDEYGPITIPAKGATIELTIGNLPVYRRIIDIYEGNDLEVKDGKIIINGEVATSYTFNMDYYFMMGDNRHNSADSRFWGFVPEDHIVGKALFIWMSMDPEKGFFDGKIRGSRIFSGID